MPSCETSPRSTTTPLALYSACELTWVVSSLGDAVLVAATVRRWCRELALPSRREWEIAIVASELATNIAKYAPAGTLRLGFSALPAPTITVEARDSGPGIPDIEQALEDGVSQGIHLWREPSSQPASSLGSGLGAVRRLSDDVTIDRLPEGGTRIAALIHLSPMTKNTR